VAVQPEGWWLDWREVNVYRLKIIEEIFLKIK
jgi:hypothetical protein